MELLLAAGVIAVVLAAALLAARRWQHRPSPAVRPWVTEGPAGARVVLDLRPGDPGAPAVQRLVDEAAAPNVRHVGIEALQRMADALRAGADPLDFVLGPALVR